jgi:hypothetical protein
MARNSGSIVLLSPLFPHVAKKIIDELLRRVQALGSGAVFFNNPAAKDALHFCGLKCWPAVFLRFI